MILTIISFLLVLTLLVFVHELGHFLAARHVGVRVDKFSIGFPPKAYGKKIGDTEYILSWLPLGGYVKLFGMNGDDEDPEHPENYASKSTLQKAYILVGGPLMNLVLALLVMPFVYGIGVDIPAYRMDVPVLSGVTKSSRAELAGFQTGDRILLVGEMGTANWEDVYSQVGEQSLATDTLTFVVSREKESMTLLVSSKEFQGAEGFGWEARVAPVVGRVISGSAADTAGLKSGDKILNLNKKTVPYWDAIPKEVQASKGKPLDMVVEREGSHIPITLTPQLNPETGRYLIGIGIATVRRTYGWFDSIVLGTERIVEITAQTFSFLGVMVTGGGSMDQVGGPVKIGMVIGDAARSGFSELLFFISVISLQLFIFNLLPIPVLDGGHLVILGVEKITGGPLSQGIKEKVQLGGFSLLFLFFIFVTYNDILRLFK